MTSTSVCDWPDGGVEAPTAQATRSLNVEMLASDAVPEIGGVATAVHPLRVSCSISVVSPPVEPTAQPVLGAKTDSDVRSFGAARSWAGIDRQEVPFHRRARTLSFGKRLASPMAKARALDTAETPFS